MEASGKSLAETKNEFEKYLTKTEIDGIYYNSFNVRYFRNLLETAVSEQKNIDNEQQRVIYNRVEWCSRIAVKKPQALTMTRRPGTVSTAPAIIMIGKQSNDIC